MAHPHPLDVPLALEWLMSSDAFLIADVDAASDRAADHTPHRATKYPADHFADTIPFHGACLASTILVCCSGFRQVISIYLRLISPAGCLDPGSDPRSDPISHVVPDCGS